MQKYGAGYPEYKHSHTHVSMPYTFRHTYSIVAPVHNVEQQLDAFFTSLGRQTASIVQSAEILCVDDGSEDQSASVIARWQRRLPNIRYFYKEHGGRASARNFGLERAAGSWVTYIDPADYVDEKYFEAVDRFLADPENAAVDMLCCRRLFYSDWTGTIRDTHYLRHQFHNGPRRVAASACGAFMEPSNSSVFYRRSLLVAEGVRNEEDIRPFFEDTEMNIRFVLAMGDRHIGIAPDAVYYQRVRMGTHSFVDSMKNFPGFYDCIFDNGYIRLLQMLFNKYGRVPEFAQRHVLTSLLAQASFFASSYGAQYGKKFTDPASLHARIARTLSFCDAALVRRADGNDAPTPMREHLLERYMGEPRERVWIDVQKYDPYKRQLKFSHIGKIPLIFRQGGKDVQPAFYKRRLRVFLDEQLDPEHIYWLPVDDATIPIVALGTPHAIGFSCRGQDLGEACSPQRALNLLLPSSMAADMPSQGETRYKDCWIFMDRHEQADDNAEHLYWYVTREHPEIRAYFAVRKTSSHWERMQAKGATLLDYGSEEFSRALGQCLYFISSHADYDDEAKAFIARRGMRHLYNFILLKHGVTKSDFSSRLSGDFACFITATLPEFKSIAGDDNYYRYTAKEVVLTGFPRADALLGNRQTPERKIFVMPTWRSYLPTLSEHGAAFSKEEESAIRNSSFLTAWKAFFHSPALRRLCEQYAHQVVFWPHFKMLPYVPLFELPDFVTLATEEACSIQNFLVRSSIFLTDYTSVAFDAALLRRYVIYYQFDAAQHLDGSHNMTISDYYCYERDGFGPVSHDLDDLMRRLERACARSGKPESTYANRIDATFPFQDTDNCRRVFDAIATITRCK